MTKRLVWPVDLQRQEDGSILVSFPDIPEALTEGATEAEALVEAQDCVIAALGGYVEGRHPIPAPSPVRGRTSVALPVLVAAKIALYAAMHEQGVGNTALAERLGLIFDRNYCLRKQCSRRRRFRVCSKCYCYQS